MSRFRWNGRLCSTSMAGRLVMVMKPRLRRRDGKRNVPVSHLEFLEDASADESFK